METNINAAAEATQPNAVPVDNTPADIRSDEAQGGDGPYIESTARLAAITATLCLGAFMISMDRTVITVALPSITDEFHSAGDMGWYASAYLMFSCAAMPLFGKIYLFTDARYTYLMSLLIFIIGSTICAFAPDTQAFISGRSIAGFGSAGMFAGTLIISCVAKPGVRIILMGLGGLTMSIASILGPLIGGVLTTRVSWRSCFYINLPIGGVLVVAIILLKLPAHISKRRTGASSTRAFDCFDIVGMGLLLVATVMLFSALQNTADGNGWSDPLTIGLLTGSFVAACLLAGWLWFRGEDAIIPPRLLVHRTMAAAGVAAFALYGTLTLIVYFLPLFYQTVKNMSAGRSAVALLPYLLSTALSALAAAILFTKSNMPPIYTAAFFACAGSSLALIPGGFLTTVNASTRAGFLIEVQIFLGIGIGIAIQQSQNILHFTLEKDDLIMSMCLVQFWQALGGAIAASVGNAVFLEVLRSAVPANSQASIATSGSTAFRSLPPSEVAKWLAAYNQAFRAVFILITALIGVGLLASCFLGMGRKISRVENETNEA